MKHEEILPAFDPVKVMSLLPGDVVLFRCEQRITAQMRERIVKMMEEVFPNHESVILECGQNIEVLRPEPGLLGRLLALMRGGNRG